VRYARRLGFTIAPDTRHLISTALGEGVFERLSGQRLRRELEVLLAEPHPTLALDLVADLGLLPAICPGLKWPEGVRSYLMEVEGQLAWYQLEHLGAPPLASHLFLGGLALSAGADVVREFADRLQLGGPLREQFLALPASVDAIKNVANSGMSLSQQAQAVEQHSVEALLLAMSDLPLQSRRNLANAAVAAVRVKLPVTGQNLIDGGVTPGPHIGRALKLTRDALIDDMIAADEALRWALQTARSLETEAPQ
jgi:tRNA nucleotidyltransferase (CCA-adding enzyme)